MSTLAFTFVWNVWLATALAVVVGTVCRWRVFQHRPALTHALWLLVLAKLVTPPLISVPVLSRVGPKTVVEHARVAPTGVNVAAPHSSPTEWPLVEAGLVPAETAPMDDAKRKPAWSVTWRAILLAASVGGTLFLATRSLSQLVRMSRILRRAMTCDERLAGLARTAAGRMGLREALAVCAVDAAIVPFLWVRFGNPVIVLPTNLVNRLNDEQITCILSHELAHFARRDHWANRFAFLVTILFWWNPVAWWARREMRAAQEVCCDGLVLATKAASRRCYAETLFQALEFVQTCHPLHPGVVSGFGDSSSLKRRFEMIATLNVNPRFSRGAAIFVFTCAAAMLCVPVRGQSRAEGADTQAAADLKQDDKRQPKQLSVAQHIGSQEWYLTKVNLDKRSINVSDAGDNRWQTRVQRKSNESVSVANGMSLDGLPVATDATILIDGEKRTLSDLKEGMRLALRMGEDKPSLTRITATTSREPRTLYLLKTVDADKHTITVSISEKRPVWGAEWVFSAAERAESGAPLVTLPVAPDASIRREWVELSDGQGEMKHEEIKLSDLKSNWSMTLDLAIHDGGFVVKAVTVSE